MAFLSFGLSLVTRLPAKTLRGTQATLDPCLPSGRSRWGQPAPSETRLLRVYMRRFNDCWLPRRMVSSRELTYPTLGSSENHRLKSAIFGGDMWSFPGGYPFQLSFSQTRSFFHGIETSDLVKAEHCSILSLYQKHVFPPWYIWYMISTNI